MAYDRGPKVGNPIVRNVQNVQANRSAFAAIREDGSVVTWGDAACGGDSGSLVAE